MHEEVEIYKQEFSFVKTQNPKIHIQKFVVEDIGICGKKIYFDQYFFVDFRNRVTMMYPNY